MDLTKKEETQKVSVPKEKTIDLLEVQDLFVEEKVDTKAEVNALAAEYKRELDMQRETMVRWKQKIQGLSKEIVNIEQERNIADQEYKNKMAKLKRNIADQEYKNK